MSKQLVNYSLVLSAGGSAKGAVGVEAAGATMATSGKLAAPLSKVTAAQRAEMDADVQAVRTAFAQARAVVENAADAWFADDAAQAVLKQLQDQTKTLEAWATTWRAWAEEGREPNGDAYPLSFWRQVGQDLASFAAFAGKQAGYTLTTRIITDTATATASTAATVVLPSKWPAWVWLAGAGVVALVVLAVVVPRIEGVVGVPWRA